MKVIKKERKLIIKDLIQKIKDRLKDCYDFKCIQIGKNTNMYIIYFNGLIDTRTVDQDILKPIAEFGINNFKQLKKHIENGKIYNISINESSNIDKIIDEILSGNTAIVSSNSSYIFETKGFKQRSIEEPRGERTSKGPKDCFIEVLNSNIATVRRRTKSTKLKTKLFSIGEITKTDISLVYIEDQVDTKILENVIQKLSNMNIPAITSLVDFEEKIVDNNKSIFPQFSNTERPDKFCSNILEGKIGIIIDGFSNTYIVPGLFAMFMQSAEEYTNNYIISSMVRLLRYISLLISLLLPAIYVAITTFHQEMLPTKLIQAIINSKQDVPFPAFLEIIIMLVAFELLLEAGAIMPDNIGQTVSIVGGLIIGEAAVNAKFVSPAVVVVIATSGICEFLIPNHGIANVTRINRLILVFSATIAGLFGVSVAIIGITYYMCNLDSFGTAYLKPFVANNNENRVVDTIFRGLIKKTKNNMARW